MIRRLASVPSLVASAADRPRARAARCTVREAAAASLCAAAISLASSLEICTEDSLMNVPGPKTTLAGRVRASTPHGPPVPPWAATAEAGSAPDRHPSRPISRCRSLENSHCASGPRTITTTDSVPKLR